MTGKHICILTIWVDFLTRRGQETAAPLSLQPRPFSRRLSRQASSRPRSPFSSGAGGAYAPAPPSLPRSGWGRTGTFLLGRGLQALGRGLQAPVLGGSRGTSIFPRRNGRLLAPRPSGPRLLHPGPRAAVLQHQTQL